MAADGQEDDAMPDAHQQVRRSLKRVQQLARQRRGPGGVSAQERQIPGDSPEDEPQIVRLSPGAVAAIEQARDALEADLSFEYMTTAEADLWKFAGSCIADRSTDHSGEFIRQYARELAETICCFGIEFLTVEAASQIGEVWLLPLDDPDVAKARLVFVGAAATVGCIAAVPVRGTSPTRMADRGQPAVQRALQVLRVAMREHPGYNAWQLRFRLAPGWVFIRREFMHWSASPDTSLNVTLPEDLPGVLSAPVARLAISADKQVEKKALVALEWMERAYLSGDRLVKMLYLFFALESLLGDTQEGLKSHVLAYRQMMLSHVVTGGFENPDSTLDMYVKIRNAAVHGEDLPDVSQGVVGYFEWSVRDALNQYLELAEREGFRSRSQLTRFLDTHADRPQLFDWLRQHGDREWAAYLDKDESAAVCTPDGSEATSDEESRPQDKEASGEAERKPGNSSAAQHCGN